MRSFEVRRIPSESTISSTLRIHSGASGISNGEKTRKRMRTVPRRILILKSVPLSPSPRKTRTQKRHHTISFDKKVLLDRTPRKSKTNFKDNDSQNTIQTSKTSKVNRKLALNYYYIESTRENYQKKKPK